MNSGKLLKTTIQIAGATLLLFIALEGIFYAAGTAPGASHFVEAIVMREGLSTRKPQGEFRIFAYGESTMHGCHYAPVSSPARWLEFYLRDLLPERNIRVINFARLGKGSDFTYQTFRETLPYKPDLAVFYLGHNDFSKRHRKDDVLEEKETLGFKLKEGIKNSRFLSAFWRQIIKLKMKRKEMEVRDQVGYDLIETPIHTGLGTSYAVRRSDPFYMENVEFFTKNVSEMIANGKAKKIPQVYFIPVCNLKDFPPNHSMNRSDLDEAGLKEWKRLFEKGKRAQEKGNAEEAMSYFQEAYQIDPTFADLLFRMGQIYFQMGEMDEARRYFEGARDYDVIALRAPREIIQFVRELPTDGGVEVIDTEKAVVAEIPGGILGEPIVEDNVHFSIRGHSLLAAALARKVAARGWIAPRTEWKWEAERPYEQIAESMGVDQELLYQACLKMTHYFGPRFDNRLRFARRAIELKPEDSRGYRALAWTYWLMNDKDKAVEIYRRLKVMDPQGLERVFEAQPQVRQEFEKRSSELPLDGL